MTATRAAGPPSAETSGTAPPTLPPGPSGLAWWRYFAQFMTSWDPLDLFMDLTRDYGPIVRFELPRGDFDVYVVARPEYAEHVMLRNPDNYDRVSGGVGGDVLDYVLGDGLLTSGGELWERQHRLIAPMFHRKSVRGFAELMLEETRRMLDRWQPNLENGAPLDLQHEMSRVTLLIISKALFSADVEGHVSTVRDALASFRGQNRQGGLAQLTTFPLWVPTPTNQAIKQARSNLDEIVYGLIEDRRGREEEYQDFLSMLMLAEDEETGERMDDEQIRDEVMTFFLAGHDTTANALTWTWFLLGRHPEAHERVHREALEHPMEDGFDRDTYGELTCAERVIKESMRIHPPVPGTGRTPEEDDVMDGYLVPAGTRVVTSPYVMHRSPEIWDEPTRFDPDRFLPEAEEKRERFAFMPFGGGQRICTGRAVAHRVGRLSLSEVTRRVRLELQDPDTPPGRDAAVTMQPGRPLKVVPHRWE